MPAIVLGTGLVGGADAADALVDAELARRRLRPHGAREGLSRMVGRRQQHALRNSLITVTTVIGLQLGALISGAVITEQIFGIAGFGRLTIDAVEPARLRADPGSRARRRRRLRGRQPARRRRLLAPQSAHPRVGGTAVSFVDTTAVGINPRARRRKLLRKRFLRRPLAIVGLVVALAFIASALLAPLIAPYSASTTDFNATLAPPFSHHHLLGTDELGRDQLSRIIWGSRASIQAGVLRDAARDGDRRADRARRRLLPRLDRPGDRAADRRPARVPVPHPRGRARRDPRAVAAERDPCARDRRGPGADPDRARRGARAARGGLRARRDRERRQRRLHPRPAHPPEHARAR